MGDQAETVLPAATRTSPTLQPKDRHVAQTASHGHYGILLVAETRKRRDWAVAHKLAVSPVWRALVHALFLTFHGVRRVQHPRRRRASRRRANTVHARPDRLDPSRA